MNWKEYEREIHEELLRRYPNVPITKNAKVLGCITLKMRQIDVLIEPQLLDSPFRIIVDAKFRKHPIDVNDVESFISMMHDVKADRGFLISTAGYTDTAIQRAHKEPNQDIELDVFSLADLKYLQGELAIPYRGKFGVLLDAPFGWVVDGQQQRGFPACLYQRGLDLNSAGMAKEWMYVNFWAKETPDQSLEDLLKIQAENMRREKLDAKLSYHPGVDRQDAKTQIRLAEIPSYPTPEYTGFVEFKDFIFFSVLFTTPQMAKRNLRKLRDILRTVKPIYVKQDARLPNPALPNPPLNSDPA